MPTTPDYSGKFVGSAEAAELLDIGPTNFSHLRKKMADAGDENFPEPAMQFRMGPAWLKADMLKFKKHYDARRRRVRPTNGDAPVIETPVETKAPAKAAAKAPAKPRGKSTTEKATVTDIKAKPKLVRAKQPVSA
jgi:hypothetical protein